MTRSEIRRLREEVLRVTRDQMAASLGTSTQTVYYFDHGPQLPSEFNRVVLAQMAILARDPAKVIGMRAAIFAACQQPAAPPAEAEETTGKRVTDIRKFGMGDLLSNLFGDLPRWPDLTEKDIALLRNIAGRLDAGGPSLNEEIGRRYKDARRLEEARARVVDVMTLAKMLVKDLGEAKSSTTVETTTPTRGSGLIERAMSNLAVVPFLKAFCEAEDKEDIAIQYVDWCEAWAVKGETVACPFTRPAPKTTSRTGSRTR
jgi:hypothetical protein